MSRTGGFRLLNLVNLQEHIYHHVWFIESMQSRFDALTGFDLNVLDGLHKDAAGGTVTREQRIAIKLRELYELPEPGNPDYDESEELTIVGQTITRGWSFEAERPGEGYPRLVPRLSPPLGRKR